MSAQPRFTVISAVHDVGRYLPEFIAAIEAQDFDLSRVEVVMVDDGSTDDSHQILLDWAARAPDLVTVVSQPNAGQGAARNAGLALARGEWVTFPDPDDVLAANYLTAVDGFVSANPTVQLVATNRLIWTESTGSIADTHPLHRFFSYDRLADLEVNETSFHGSAPAGFFRLSAVRENDLRFDPRIRPNFEDGHFCSLYLLHCEKPVVGFLASTAYHYRKRANRSSALQGSMLDRRRYTDVFEFGYHAILASAIELRGAVPRWLQHFLTYELIGYLSSYEAGNVPSLAAGPETEALHANIAATLDGIDLEQVLPRVEYGVMMHLRHALEHGYDEEPWVDDHVFVDAFEPLQGVARVRYYFTGDPPAEAVFNGEVETGAQHAKTRDLTFFGRTLIRERILWVRYAPDLRVRINGEWAAVQFDRTPPGPTRVLPVRVRRLTGVPSRHDRRVVEEASATPRTTPRARRKYADAWVLMDRIHNAGDSAEVLFGYLRRHRPEINAWFVIEAGTPDWKRLHAEFGARVIAHGSTRWMTLMAHCTNLLSSHADVPITEPAQLTGFTARNWKFTFLQHGVIKDDLSTWLNRKQIDVFVTSTRAELDSIAGDGTPYPFTTKETQLTGLPRFDRLREIGQRFGPDERDLVLVAPTWREWLVGGLESGTQRRGVDAAILGSDFVVQWLELLRSPELATACREQGLTLAFLPHPNLAALLPLLDLPSHVLALTYDGADVGEYFARARVLVTDYSSIAFNAAYLDRPVVYFQFDADLVMKGGHVGRAGYFSYERDGFGPVLGDASAAAGAVVASLDLGASPSPEYQARIDAAFPVRDGRCCERVTAAVLALREPIRETRAGGPQP